ncbi:MAG: hypothetical protein IJ482_05545 [Alphaproteobacteria bacterium]|nr:hypothetical protein [Alphaproteobacteria bacterium]
MHITNLQKFSLGALVLAFAASCSISTSMDATLQRETEAATKLTEAAKEPTPAANQDLIKVKDEIWLGDSSEVEYEGEPLPSYLETKEGITLVSNRPITLYEIGDMINKTTSLGIRYAAQLETDVLTKGAANEPTPATMNKDWAAPDKMLVSYQGPLSGLLDEIATRFGIWWKYEKKEIHFYKYITKTFVVYSLPTKPTLSINVGGSSSDGSGSSSVSLANSAEVELWANFEKSITSIISDGAKLSMSPADGTITLTATPNDIKKVAKYINEQNARLSRQVAISVKVLQVTATDTDNYGLDLKAAFDDGVTKVGVIGSSAATGGESGLTNGLSWGLTKKNWNADAAIKALSQRTNTSLVTSGTVTTLNNKPAPIQVTQKQNYIAEMTKTNSGTDGNNYDISVTTEEVETGFTLDVLPRILEHGRMLVLFNMTLSDLTALEKVEFGDAESNQYIQNPKIESRAFSQELAMTSGESLILTGYEKVSSSVEKEGTGSADNSLLGGYANADKERSVLVIILTPIVLESPLVPESRMSMN